MPFSAKIIGGFTAGGALVSGVGRAMGEVTRASRAGEKPDWMAAAPKIALWTLYGAFAGFGAGYLTNQVLISRAAKEELTGRIRDQLKVGNKDRVLTRVNARTGRGDRPDNKALIRQARKILRQEKPVTPARVQAASELLDRMREVGKSPLEWVMYLGYAPIALVLATPAAPAGPDTGAVAGSPKPPGPPDPRIQAIAA